MKNRKLSLVDYLAIIGLCVWGLGLLVLMAMGKIQHFERYHKAPSLLPFVLGIIWILLGFGFFKLFIAYVDHQDKNYRAAHVTRHTVTDERFGTLTFDFDDVERSLTSACAFPPFGNASPETVSIGSIGSRTMEEGLALLLEAVNAAYDHQEEILTELHHFIKTSFETKKVDLPLAFIRSDFLVTSLTVCTDRPESDLTVVIEGHTNDNQQYKVTEFSAFTVLLRSPDGSAWKLHDTSHPEAPEKK